MSDGGKKAGNAPEPPAPVTPVHQQTRVPTASVSGLKKAGS